MNLKQAVAIALLTLSTSMVYAEHSEHENGQGQGHQGSSDDDSSGGGSSVTNTNTNTNTSNNTNRNNNNNTNSNTNSNSNTNTSTSSATGGSATSSSNAKGGKGGRGGNASNSASTGSNSSTTSVVVQGDNYPDIPVASAYAPNVQVGGADMCRSGVSGGSQTSAFGISLGGTVVDTNCERLKLSREIAVTLGDKETAKQLLCQDPRVAKAYAHSGSPCHVDATVVDTKVTTSTSATPFGNR